MKSCHLLTKSRFVELIISHLKSKVRPRLSAVRLLKMSFAAPFEEGTFQHLVILPDFESWEIVTVKE